MLLSTAELFTLIIFWTVATSISGWRCVSASWMWITSAVIGARVVEVEEWRERLRSEK